MLNTFNHFHSHHLIHWHLFPKVPENLAREIVFNLNKLVKDLQNRESSEAMAYLKLMGIELGYIKSNELKSIAENALMYAEMFMKIMPTKVVFCIPLTE